MSSGYSKALIIDDDSDLCLMLRSVIKKAIPEVEYAHTLAAGKELLNQLKPEVIFLDNNLPDGQGLHLVKEIKESLPGVFIVFISAVDLPGHTALEYGADVFLEKPFSYSSIFQALRIDPNSQSS
ncbi:MAG TPA: response regulator [Chitinophagales bacterium]|nr:response regulator [Chitinophagales bacterium]